MGNLLKINAQYLAYNQSIHPSTHLPTKMICHHHLQNDMYRLKIGFPMNNLDYFCPPHYTTPWQCCCCGSSSRSQRRPVHRDRRFSLFISETKRTRAAFVCRHHHRPHVPSRPVPSRRRLTIWAVLLLLGDLEEDRVHLSQVSWSLHTLSLRQAVELPWVVVVGDT